MTDRDKLVVIGTSAGGVSALTTLVARLRHDLPATVLVVLHVGMHESSVPEVLSSHSALSVRHALDGEPIEPGAILIAPPDRHLLVEPDRVRLSPGPKENFARPAIDPLFRSAAITHREHVIGMVLTGMLDDGAAGLRAIKAYGGTAIVQDPATAEAPGMPRSALEHVDVDHCLPLDRIPDELIKLIEKPVEPEHQAVSDQFALENAYASRGRLAIEELEKIARPSSFTCPECHGALWEIEDSSPQRFRCRVGHGYTLQALFDLQHEEVEDALWAAIRALDEKEALLKRLAESATDQQRTHAAAEHQESAERAGRHSKALIDMMLG